MIWLAAVVICVVFWPVTLLVLGAIASFFILKWLLIATVTVIGAIGYVAFMIADKTFGMSFTYLSSNPQILAMTMIVLPFILISICLAIMYEDRIKKLIGKS